MSDQPTQPETRVEPKPDTSRADPGLVRGTADRFYVSAVKATAFLDHPMPPKEPTESQKFRANVLLTCIGSLVFGFAILVIQDGFRRSEAAVQANSQRLIFLHDELKQFSDVMPQIILRTYEQSKLYASYMRKPREAGDDTAGPDGERWRDIYAKFEAARDQLAALPQPDVICRRVQFYLKTDAARADVEAFRVALKSLFDATTPEAVETAMTQTNNAWDKAMESLSGEFTR